MANLARKMLIPRSGIIKVNTNAHVFRSFYPDVVASAQRPFDRELIPILMAILPSTKRIRFCKIGSRMVLPDMFS